MVPGVEEIYAEDMRQAVIVLDHAVSVSAVDELVIGVGDEWRERIRRACDVLNFLGGQLAAAESIARASNGIDLTQTDPPN